MLTILLGSDPLAKKEMLTAEAKRRGAEVHTFNDSNPLPNLDSLFEPQLFGAPKVVVMDHLWKKLSDADVESLLKFGEDKSAVLFVIEDSLDKRKKINQEFLKDKRVNVVQLDAPVGTAMASHWITKYAGEKNILIEPPASQALARALLIDEDSVLDVARAQSELAKLSAYADGQTITKDMVGELTENITGVDIFALLNAIAAKNKKLALLTLEDYFRTEAADEKSNAIKVVALLADQFRSLLMAIDAGTRNLPDAAVLQMTAWKSGRLFMMKKLSRNFNAKQLQSALSKLENLDRELKTGSMPPHVVLDLIIADI